MIDSRLRGYLHKYVARTSGISFDQKRSFQYFFMIFGVLVVLAKQHKVPRVYK